MCSTRILWTDTGSAGLASSELLANVYLFVLIYLTINSALEKAWIYIFFAPEETMEISKMGVGILLRDL